MKLNVKYITHVSISGITAHFFPIVTQPRDQEAATRCSFDPNRSTPGSRVQPNSCNSTTKPISLVPPYITKHEIYMIYINYVFHSVLLVPSRTTCSPSRVLYTVNIFSAINPDISHHYPRIRHTARINEMTFTSLTYLSSKDINQYQVITWQSVINPSSYQMCDAFWIYSLYERFYSWHI